MTKRQIDYWVIPPDQDAEFVAGMEEVLENLCPAPIIPISPRPSGGD
ncbi:MAG: hypothetical protein H6632_13045 [Anaerolineales bacterium]|nr:hypothetical protein [Anaerolineales bacterium]